MKAKVLLILLILSLSISCKVKQKSLSTSETKSEKRTKSSSIEVTATRPPIHVFFEKTLEVLDNRITPVVKTFEREGVKVTVTINDKNELFAEILIPGDTLKKVTTESEIADQESVRSLTSHEKEKDAFSGLPTLIFKILITAGLLFGIYKFIISKIKWN